jgi:hypothetical protein
MKNSKKVAAAERFTTKNLLGASAHWQVNKQLADELQNPLAALLLAWLIDQEDYFVTNRQVVHREGRQWFYVTTEKVEQVFYIGYRAQLALFKLLIDAGVLYAKRMQRPAKKYYSIDHDRVLVLAIGKTQDLTLHQILDLLKKQNIDLTKKQFLDLLKKQNTTNNRVVLRTNTNNQVLDNAPAATPPPPPKAVETGEEGSTTAADKANDPVPEQPQKKKKTSGAKKKKLDGLTIDKSFQACLKAFHDRHEAYHRPKAESAGEAYLPIDWSLKKERGNLNRLAKSVRRLAAAKLDCKPAEVDSQTVANGLAAILLRMEKFTDQFIARNHYTPSGVHSQWTKITNKIQTELHDESNNKKRRNSGSKGAGRSQDIRDLVNAEELLASLNTPRYA